MMDSGCRPPSRGSDNSFSNAHGSHEQQCVRPGGEDSLASKLSEIIIGYSVQPPSDSGFLGTPPPCQQQYRLGNKYKSRWSTQEGQPKRVETSPFDRYLSRRPLSKPTPLQPKNYSPAALPLPNLSSQPPWTYSSSRSFDWGGHDYSQPASFNTLPRSESCFSWGYQPLVAFAPFENPHMKYLYTKQPSLMDVAGFVQPKEPTSLASFEKLLGETNYRGCFSQNPQREAMCTMCPCPAFGSDVQLSDTNETSDDFMSSPLRLFKHKRRYYNKNRKTYPNEKRTQVCLEKNEEEKLEPMETATAAPEEVPTSPSSSDGPTSSMITCFQSNPNGETGQYSTSADFIPERVKRKPYCRLCRSNRETQEFYESHVLSVNNVVTCPVLRSYECPNCKGTGDNAHTAKYCPSRLAVAVDSVVPKYKNYITRTSTGGFRVSKF